MKLTHLSASSIQSWLDCPNSWLGRQLKWSEQRNPLYVAAAALGTAVHCAIAGHHAGQDADVALVRGWEAAMAQCAAVGAPEPDMRTGFALARLYASTVPTTPGDRCEVKFSFAVPGIPIPVIGYLDVIVNGGELIREVKTTRSIRNWTPADIGSSLQGTAYWLAALSAGIAHPRLTYSILRIGAESAEHVETTRTAAQIAEFADTARRAYAGMLSGEMAATCRPGWCRYPEQCGRVTADKPAEERLGTGVAR